MDESQKVFRQTFVAERQHKSAAQGRVSFVYQIDGSGELLISDAWWKQMGSPDTLQITYEPFDDEA